MKLLDELLTGNFHAGTADKQAVMEVLEQAQLVIADDVVDFWLAHDTPDAEAAIFPNVMLPFERVFIETLWTHNTGQHKLGVLLFMETQGADKFIGAKWVMYGHVFIRTRANKTPALLTRFGVGVADDGRVVSGIIGTNKIWFLVYPCHDTIKSKEQNMSAVRLAMPAALFAISFMHCRNVRMDMEVPPVKLSKIHERRHGRPLLTYRVLKIDRMKEVLEREGHLSSEGLKKALHTCRGHFKRYGVDGKGLLFGKHAATVWVPGFARGSIEQGLVVKDYEVC